MNYTILFSTCLLSTLFSAHNSFTNPEQPPFVDNPHPELQFERNFPSWNTTTHFDDGRRDKQTGKVVKKPTIAVMHYSGHPDLESSLRSLARNHVSVHYVIDRDGNIVKLVDDQDSAYQAGIATYKPHSHEICTSLNAHSNGIMFVNKGWERTSVVTTLLHLSENKRVPGSETMIGEQPFTHITWQPYTKEQIRSAALLIAYLERKKDIQFTDLVAHGQIASPPGRKVAPGPLFPWQDLKAELEELKAEGLYKGFCGIRANLSQGQIAKPITHFQTEEDRITWMQLFLNKYGFNCPITGKIDTTTRAIIQEFQMRECPENIDGSLDDRTLHVANDLNKQISTIKPGKKDLLPHCFE